MPQTNRIPGGFLDLIGAETGGKNPSQYSDTLQATIESKELYLGQTLKGNLISQNHAAVGVAADITVPSDEHWLLRCVNVEAVLPLTTDFERWVVGLTRLPRDVGFLHHAVFWSTRLLQTAAAGQFPSDAFMLPDPILCTPGMIVRAILKERDASAARNTTLRIAYNKLT